MARLIVCFLYFIIGGSGNIKFIAVTVFPVILFWLLIHFDDKKSEDNQFTAEEFEIPKEKPSVEECDRVIAKLERVIEKFGNEDKFAKVYLMQKLVEWKKLRNESEKAECDPFA